MAKAAARFAGAVNQIAENCGEEDEQLVQSGHPRLPAEVVVQIARTHPDRQRYELAQVRAGRKPFASPPAGVEPPFDTLNPAELLSRLRRNAGALNWAADGLLATARARWPCDKAIAAVIDHASGIRRAASAMLRRVNAGAVAPGGARGTEERAKRQGPGYKTFAPGRVLSAAAGAAKVTAKNVRDLPRTLVDTPPTAAEWGALASGLRRLGTAAARLLAVARAAGHAPQVKPAAVPGTYVVFFRLAEDVRGLKVGELGTFDFPAGVYGYLGSAFGGGGVLNRTHRHLTAVTPRKWNIDWLKPLCVPVAVWWTHDRHKVEFDWADVLARLPGGSFPVPGFGASDNRRARAHLVRFDEVPAVAGFRQRVRRRLSGHAPVYEKVVANWSRIGWPG